MSDTPDKILNPGDIARSGSIITLPEDPWLPIVDAIEILKLKMEEENKSEQFYREFKAFPLDGAYAMYQAIEKLHGHSVFASVSKVIMPISIDETIEVPWGAMYVPGTEKGWVRTSFKFDYTSNQMYFTMTGETMNKYIPKLVEIADETKRILETKSLYRGKAFRMDFPEKDSHDSLNYDPTQCQPEFLDLRNVQVDQLILPESTMAAVDAGLFFLLRSSVKELNKLGTGFHRRIVLAGDYGVGKSLAAMIAAKLCGTNGKTFVYTDVRDLDRAVLFARQYQPAMVFCEDVDLVASGDRTDELNRILNVVDGIETKHDDVSLLFTTNNLNLIHGAFKRSGRSDWIIELPPPDEAAALKLLQRYLGKWNAIEDKELERVGKECAGMNACYLEEIARRAVFFSASNGNGGMVKGEDLILAQQTVRRHIELATEEKDTGLPEGWEERGLVVKRTNGEDTYLNR